MSTFSEKNLRALLGAVVDRATSFRDQMMNPSDHPIYLRFDVDDNFARSVSMAEILNDFGIRGTFFILNTAKYWNDPNTWDDMRRMQMQGHEIGWHNNVLTQLKQWQNEKDWSDAMWLSITIKSTLDKFQQEGIKITGSASHGDPLCRVHNYINYEVFQECPRTSEAINFPPCKFEIPKVSMHDLGLEYEAYHVPYDLYLSESGGNKWTWRTPETKCYGDGLHLDMIDKHQRIQILIHPQHWSIS